MKKLMFTFCIMLFSSFVIASPANIGDVEYGYSAISITSMDGLIGGGSSNVVDVGKSDSFTRNTVNTYITAKAPIEAEQVGIGLFETVNADNLHRICRSLPSEVGWPSVVS